MEWAPPGAGATPGQRVGISAIAGCGRCAACAAGIEVRCDAPGVQLCLHAERAAVALSSLRVLPPGTTAARGVLLSGDALGVPVRGLRRAPDPPGGRVLVLGLGPVGLAHVLVRSFTGCEVLAVEPSAPRRALAESLGAAATFAPEEEVPGPPPGLVIEASGRPESVARACALVAKGGTVLQSGECGDPALAPSDLIRREVTYVGSWFYASEDYPEMLALVERGLAVDDLVTHVVPAARAPEAFAHLLSPASGKILLDWA